METSTEQSHAALTRRGKALVVSAIFVAVPMLAETAVRIRDSIRFGNVSTSEQLYIPHAQLGKVPRPGAVLHDAISHVRINSLGFPRDEIVVPKPPDIFRIACLGGSTTFGSCNSGNDTTWPARLQKELDRRFPHVRVEVVNAAVPGYRLTDSRINLLQRVLPIEPDLIIIYHAYDDIKHQQRIAYERSPRATGRPTFITRWLTRRSTLFNKLAGAIHIVGTPARYEDRRDTLPAQAVRDYRQHLEALLAECRQRRLPTVLCTSATRFRAEQPDDARRKAAGAALHGNRYLSVDGLIRSYRMFNAETQALADRHGVPCADLVAAVPPDPDHFSDSIHLSEAGCEAVAAALINTLAAAELLPAGPKLAASSVPPRQVRP